MNINNYIINYVLKIQLFFFSPLQFFFICSTSSRIARSSVTFMFF